MHRMWWLALPLALLPSCLEGNSADLLLPRPLNSVSIELELVDMNTGAPVADVPVRILESTQEWSGRTKENPDPRPSTTGPLGRVLFTSRDLAEADVGFAVNVERVAVLSGLEDEDEANILFEILASEDSYVLLNVYLDFWTPHLTVSVPIP